MQDSNEAAAGLLQAAAALRESSSVAILVHNSTDGDTLGSALALAIALDRMGKGATVVCEERFPEYLNMLPEQRLITWYGDGSALEESRFDLVVAVDTGDVKLLGKRRALLDRASRTLNVDHHYTNRRYGTVNYIDVAASAVAEMAYFLIVELGALIDRDIALCLYTGICTDTGGFSYGNTTARAHFVASELMRHGIDVAHLRYAFFDAINMGKLRCHGFIAQTIRFFYGARLAVAVVTQDALRSMGAMESDCDGLVDIGRNVIGVQVSALAREVRPCEFRVNLRSRKGADVSAVAAAFGGGGHVSAAGCTIWADGSEVVGMIVRATEGLWPGMEAGDGGAACSLAGGCGIVAACPAALRAPVLAPGNAAVAVPDDPRASAFGNAVSTRLAAPTIE